MVKNVGYILKIKAKGADTKYTSYTVLPLQRHYTF